MKNITNGFTQSACGTFPKNKEKCKNLDKQEIGDILIKRNYKLSAFSTIWFL